MKDILLAVLTNGPMLPSDAIVVLSGDGLTRVAVAVQLLRQRGAENVVVSGALDKPPFSLTAKRLEAELLMKGAAPRMIHRLDEGSNTYEEVQAVVRLAIEKEWHRLLVVTSSFHCYRAFLSFVQVLKDAGKENDIHVLMVPASQARWSEVPPGAEKSRMDMLGDEFKRIAEYQEKGHVADYNAGLDYYLHWEKAA